MKIEKVKLRELSYYPRNPRRASKALIEKIIKSIQEFGYLVPMVVNERNQVISGNQRLSALKKILLPEEEVEVIRVSLPPEKEAALNLALNKIQGSWDMQALNEVLKSIPQEILPLTGFEVKELAILDVPIVFQELDKHAPQGVQYNYGDMIPVQIGKWLGYADAEYEGLEEILLQKGDNLKATKAVANQILALIREAIDSGKL